MCRIPLQKEIRQFQNSVKMNRKPNLPVPSDSQTKPIGLNYLKTLSQPCRMVSDLDNILNLFCRVEAKIAVPSVFKSLKYSADEECITKVDEEERVDTNSGCKMCKFREDCTEKSRANEKKTVVEEKGATDDEYATNEDEEGKDLKSGRNMGKFREDCPEKSNIDEEETKTKPVEEDDSRSPRVRSGLNSRDLKAPVESPGAEVAQIMSEPDVFIQRINEDPPIVKHGRGPIWLTRLATNATSWSASFLTAMARRSPLNCISAVRSELSGDKMIEVKNEVYMKNENSAEVINKTRDEILSIVSQLEDKSQGVSVSNDEAMVRTDHSTVPVKISKCVTEEVDDEKSEVTCEEVPKYELEKDCDNESVELIFNELVIVSVYQVPYKAEDNSEHYLKLPEKEPDIFEEKADITDEIAAKEELLKIAKLFESSTMPVKIPKCPTKREKISRTVPGKWRDHFQWNKFCKFRKKIRLKMARKTCAEFIFKKKSLKPGHNESKPESTMQMMPERFLLAKPDYKKDMKRQLNQVQLPRRYEVPCTFVIRNVQMEAPVMMYESFPPHQYKVSSCLDIHYAVSNYEFNKQISEEIYEFDADDQEISKHRTDDEKLVLKPLCEGVPEAVNLQVEDQACEDAPIVPEEDMSLAENEEAYALVDQDGTKTEASPTRPKMPNGTMKLPAVEYANQDVNHFQ